MQVRTLDRSECVRLLSTSRVGRLACSLDGQPYVVPIHFAYADNSLYGFSMLGRKIDYMRSNPKVSMLIEEHGPGREWKSVVIDGRFEELPDRIGHKRDRDHAWSLLSRHAAWWEPGSLKPVIPPVSDHANHVFFRIVIDRVSGREAKEDN